MSDCREAAAEDKEINKSRVGIKKEARFLKVSAS